MSTTNSSEDFLDGLAAAVLQNPSKEFLECIPHHVRMKLVMGTKTNTRETQETAQKEREALKQDWLSNKIPNKPLKRVRFPGDTLHLK